MGLLDDTIGKELQARRKPQGESPLLQQALGFIQATPEADGESGSSAKDNALKAIANRLPEILALFGQSSSSTGRDSRRPADAAGTTDQAAEQPPHE